ncbi:SpoIIE family protein phosphatase [Microscilla marina]|nr:SpoIIE family protein phosphatase [Microscilla marina]
MHCRLFILFFLVYMFGGLDTQAQTPEIDSLESKLANTPPDVRQIKILSKLSWKLRDSDLKKALNYGIRSLKLIAQFKHHKAAAQTNNYVGVIYRNLNQYSNAITYYYRALKAAQTNNQPIQIAYAYNNIGEIFKFQNRLKDAGQNTQKAIDMFKKLNNKGGEAYAHLRLGEILQKQGRVEEAYNAYSEAAKIRENMPKQPRLDVVYNRIGNLFLEQKNYDQTFVYLTKAKEANIRNNVRGTGIYSVEVSFAKLYIEQNQLDKAILIAQNTYKKAQEIPSKPLMATSLKLLSEAYALKNEHTKAYEYQQQYIQITQEFVNTQNRYKINVLESIHQLEQKQSELELLKKEQREVILRRNFVYALIGSVLLLLGLLSVLVYNNQAKQKANMLLQIKNDQIDSKNQDITASITYAQRIQQALLYLEDANSFMPDYFVLFRPRDIVSGDFYWVEKAKGKIFMVAADCTGHGVPGAFMTMLGSQALSNIMIQNKVYDPAQVLLHLDMILRRTLKSKDTMIRDGMDIAIIVIDPQKHEMQYSGAKNSLILVQNQEVQEIKGSMYSINGHRPVEVDAGYETHTIDISIPSTFYMYSDGFQDQFGGKKGRKFMKKRFRELLHTISRQPMKEQKATLDKVLNAWMLGHDQVDDILVMGARWPGKST